MKKKTVKLTENDLRKIVRESVRMVVSESVDDDELYNIADKCINIILKTQHAGRNFTSSPNLDSNPEYSNLKQNLLSSMKQYFDSAKELLQFVADITQDEYVKKNASKYLGYEFTPNW